jgi:hypothetical protein
VSDDWTYNNGEWDDITSVLNGAREEGPVGPAAAMTVEHWANVVRILEPDATDDQVKAGLDRLVARGLMAFDPQVEIALVNGSRTTIAGYYRSAP